MLTGGYNVGLVLLGLIMTGGDVGGADQIVKYRNDHFLIPEGCPSSDPVVLSFYDHCLINSRHEVVYSLFLEGRPKPSGTWLNPWLI